MEKGRGQKGKASLPDKAASHHQTGPRTTRCNKRNETKVFKELSSPQSLPAVTHERQQPFPPGYFFKTPSEQSLSVQFHQQPTPGGAGDPEVVPILLLCTW